MMAILVVATALMAMTAGCLDVSRPEVPASIVSNADVRWQITEGGIIEDSTFAPKAIETIYFHEPTDRETFPAILSLVGLRTITELDKQDLLDVAEGVLIEKMTERGVEPDLITKQTGGRTIESGANTQWLTMLGNAEEESILFSDAEQIRTAAEAWYDESSRMHVVAIVIAQTGGTDFVGQARTELTAWNELVGDADGSIAGATHLQGFIDYVNIRS
jgi:hypothetical protein